jgi:GT2 family glycosyltransferase
VTFSVIIPTCARPEQLACCLDRLDSKVVRIIVTDDGRDDGARNLCAEKYPGVEWTAGPRRGPAANRNHGAKQAQSEWIAFVDDDCEPQPGWLAALAAASVEADVVEGRTLAPGAMDSPFEEHVENLAGGVLWSCNLAVRREVFLRLGGFDESFEEAGGEDMEFAWRVARAGLRVHFAPEAVVHHPPRRIGWKGIWRRTWMIRWMSLYHLKTGRARSLPMAAWDEIVLLLRVTAQLVTRPDDRYPRRQYFAVAWHWATFPLVLPYVLYWNWHFQRKLSEPDPRHGSS